MFRTPIMKAKTFRKILENLHSPKKIKNLRQAYLRSKRASKEAFYKRAIAYGQKLAQLEQANLKGVNEQAEVKNESIVVPSELSKTVYEPQGSKV